ncbi:heterokaryon incompatibility protein-domain-containing protein [Xylaria scruposa]|nr:heterokaryon incompatibility protein-domain-containing protein [Xylaria scruposa]
MWLVNVENYELEWFDNEDSAPPYAILSHTWVHGAETTHQYWKTVSNTIVAATSGVLKIVKCCEKARFSGYAYIWVDTCCIDKTSSAELSEAINSMFMWYQKAEVCYAYLADVPGSQYSFSLLPEDKWFTRGWTLQELIAPRKLSFYAADWSLIGTRESLAPEVTRICGIGEEYLTGDFEMRMTRLQTASIAKRMSWAALRTTTRVEDIAYCLLGIFDINIPLIYGEGKKAFRRLQEEVIKLYPDDHSIYAWGPILEPGALSTTIQLRPLEQLDKPLLGLLAQSPKDFTNSGGVIPVPWIGRFYRMPRKGKPTPAPPVIVGKSIKIDLPVRFGKFYSEHTWTNVSEVQTRPGIQAMLLCTTSNSKHSLIILPLVAWGDGFFGRTETLAMAHNVNVVPFSSVDTQQTLHVSPEIRIQPYAGDMVVRELHVTELRNLRFAGWTTAATIDFERDKILRVGNNLEGQFLACDFTYPNQMATGFSVILGRASTHGTLPPVFYMEVIPSNPPFSVSLWGLKRRKRHCYYFTGPNYSHTTIPHQLEGISIHAEVKRVLVTQPNNSERCNFIDIVDIQVAELNVLDGRNRANTVHVTGTIPMV